MKTSLEIRALRCAVLAAGVALSSTWLTATVIKAVPSTVVVAAEKGASDEVSTAPEVVRKGKEFFAMTCSHCHGDDAHGDEGPDLHNLAISNARIAATIKKGVKGEMPTFAKKYDDQQIAAIVSYLRTLK